jgi:hypothetical protein
MPEAAASAADAALIAAGEARAGEFLDRLARLRAQSRDRAPDAARASPAELLARCLARAGEG